MLFTYKDAIDHVIDAVGSEASTNERRFARRAIQSGLNDLVNSYSFSYFTKVGRIVSSAQYATGTIAYTNSTKTVTLTGGTWPSWAKYGTILIANIPYNVASVTDSTNLVLKSNTNPGADVASGTSYTLYRDTYTLPEDFVSIDKLYCVTSNYQLGYVTPEDWLAAQRWSRSPSQPLAFTITADPQVQNRQAVRFLRPSSVAMVFDYIYARRPRPLRYEEVSAGTVTTDGTTTVTGSGTAFTSNMVGSVIRLSDDDVTEPTGLEGDYPTPDTERIITAVASSTSLTVNSSLSALTGVKYVITDPVDVDEGSLLNYFKACCVKRAKIERNAHDAEVAIAHCEQELRAAMSADNPYRGADVAGSGRITFGRLALRDMRTDV